MYDLLKEFIKPELLILVPVLYLIGIDKEVHIQDKHIPYLGILYLLVINTTAILYIHGNNAGRGKRVHHYQAGERIMNKQLG